MKFLDFISIEVYGWIVWMSYESFIADKRLVKYFTTENYFSAMDMPAVLSVPPEPLHHKDNESAANKETNTSKLIINIL